MKGKATLLLSDARTGEVVKRIEEHNLVTNAVHNIFNPPHGMLIHGFDYSSLFKKGLPLWSELMGGIMLLGNTEAENADNIMLGNDIIPIATAGSEYAGSCTRRGSLNLNESYQTDNGYHFTWDFATDKANGTINCICLTSKTFGNTGFCYDNKSDSAIFAAPNNIGSTSSTSTMYVEYGYGQYIGTYEDGLHIFMYLAEDGALEFRRYRGIDVSALRINDKVGLSSISDPVSVTRVPLALRVVSEDRFFLDGDKRLVYYFGSIEDSDDTTTTISYISVNFETLETAMRTVRLQKKANTYVNMGAVFNDHIFLGFSDGISEFTLDGELIRTYKIQLTYSHYFFVIDGCLMLRTSYGTVRCFGWGDREFTSGHSLYPVAGVFPRPYIGTCNRNSHNVGSESPGNKALLVLAMDYKATINNLSSPLVKTSDHTLKIVYDITN